MNSNKKNHKDLEIQRWVKLEEFYSSYIITSVKLNDGSFHALSRYGDNIWYLPSSMFSAGISKGHRKINFSLVPVVFQEPLRQCLAIYILNGIEGRALPKGNTIQSFFFAIISFLTWLNSRNIKKLNEVTQLTTQQYVQYCKQKKNKNDEFISNYTLLEYFVAVENLHFLSKSLDYPLQHPWPNSSSNYLAGLTGQAAQESRTKIIPDGVLSLLFRSAINWLDQAEEIIEVRSKVESWKKNNRSQHYIQNNLNKEGWTLKKLRKAEQHIQAACICVVLITSGIRVSELLSLENNCAYKTMDENNEPFYWIKGITYKTGTKNCEWLVTRITHRAIAVAEKIALPIQKKLGEKIAELKLKSCNNYLAVDLEEHSKRIFLTVTMQHKNKIDTMSKGGVIHRLNEFASQCGIKWRLSPHQFRRTFAVYAAHSVFGDLRYLRDHFKHWSLDMTALYAMSQHQDAELYDSIGLTALNIKTDIIEASISSHAGDNFLALYAKTLLMNKYKNKGVGLNAISSYKRASNILDKAGKGITGRPDAVLFRKDEEKILHEKINEIRKAFTVKDDNKDYESLLIKLSDTKESTDNFFDNVVVNDENQDIKNNRLELLKMFCNTFDNFIDFSKLEGL